MKKFYEAPVVELTGFSAEDVITTSVVTINTDSDTFEASAFEKAVAKEYGTGANVKVVDFGTGSYTW